MSSNKDAFPVSYAQPGLTINWGSILSGLVFILALGWLLFTLGSAIGLSIAEIHNLQDSGGSSKTAALGTAATVWILATVVATYFLGGFLAGKVSGRTDKSTGLLHGVVLWSCTIIIGIIFSAIGVSGIMNAAAGAAKSVTSTGAQAVSMMAGGMTGGHKGIDSSQLGSFLHPLTGSLKQDLNKALEKAKQTAKDSEEDSGAKNATQRSNASDQHQSKDQNSSQSSVSYKASSDEAQPTSASSDDASTKRDDEDSDDEKSAKADADTDTDTDDETREGREGQSPPRAENYSRESKEGSTEKSGSHSASKSYSQSSHHSSNGRSVDRAIEKIDPQVLMAVALALIQGDEKRAKAIISSHFDIDDAEVDKLIQAAKQKSEQVTEELEKKMNEAKDYAAGLLWVIFLSYLIGLLACISGAQLAMRSPNLLDTAGSKTSSDKKY